MSLPNDRPDNFEGQSGSTALLDGNKGAVRRLSCRTIARRGFRHEHRIRDIRAFGSSAGDGDSLLEGVGAPLPSEMLLAALGACLAVGIHANAVARTIPIETLELVLSGDVNFGALWGSDAAIPVGFEDIDIEAHILSDAPRPVLQMLMDHVLLWSPVANSLHNPISLTATVVDP